MNGPSRPPRAATARAALCWFAPTVCAARGKWDVLVPGVGTAVSIEGKLQLLLKATTTSA